MKDKFFCVLLFYLLLHFSTKSRAQPFGDRFPKVRIVAELGPTKARDFVEVRSLDTPYVDSVFLLLWDGRSVLQRWAMPAPQLTIDVRYLSPATYKVCLRFRNGDTDTLAFSVPGL